MDIGQASEEKAESPLASQIVRAVVAAVLITIAVWWATSVALDWLGAPSLV